MKSLVRLPHLLSRSRLISAHIVWARQLSEVEKRGRFDLQATTEQAEKDWKDFTRHVRASTVQVAAVTALAIVLAGVLGRLSPQLPINWAALLQFVGGGLALWATLFALGQPKTFAGNSPAEELHHATFQLSLLVGGCLAMMGSLV